MDKLSDDVPAYYKEYFVRVMFNKYGKDLSAMVFSYEMQMAHKVVYGEKSHEDWSKFVDVANLNEQQRQSLQSIVFAHEIMADLMSTFALDHLLGIDIEEVYETLSQLEDSFSIFLLFVIGPSYEKNNEGKHISYKFNRDPRSSQLVIDTHINYGDGTRRYRL